MDAYALARGRPRSDQRHGGFCHGRPSGSENHSAVRLLCIYQHAPTPGAPGIYRHRTLLAELVRRGWTVDLVSSPINYMHGAAPEGYSGRWYRREVIDGVTHHWVRASEDVHRNMKRRALNYVTFAMTATAFASTLPRPDVIWASSPPLSVASVGRALSRRFRRPWVFEVRDLWPETASSAGLLDENTRLYRLVDRFARTYASKADGVLVPTPGLVDMVKEHGAKDVTLVTGAISDNPTDPEVRRRERELLDVPDGACLFAYMGAHGIINGLDGLLDAIELVAAGSGSGSGPDDVRFVLAGDGSAREQLQRRLAERPIPTLRMLGPVPKDRVLEILAASDVALHMLRPDPLFASALPTKVLEYFGAHRAFITTVPGLPERLALESGGGFAPDVDGLAREIVRWSAMSPAERSERGDQAFAYGNERFGLEATVDRLEELLMRTVGRAERNGI